MRYVVLPSSAFILNRPRHGVPCHMPALCSEGLAVNLLSRSGYPVLPKKGKVGPHVRLLPDAPAKRFHSDSTNRDTGQLKSCWKGLLSSNEHWLGQKRASSRAVNVHHA